MDIEKFEIKRDGLPNLRFSGRRLAEVSSENKAVNGCYTGPADRWSELYLYQTGGGKYVCWRIDCSRWQGERHYYNAEVCETLEEVKEFFGYDDLAKELYEEAGIDDAVEVE